jgi:hypothetical protein
MSREKQRFSTFMEALREMGTNEHQVWQRDLDDRHDASIRLMVVGGILYQSIDYRYFEPCSLRFDDLMKNTWLLAGTSDDQPMVMPEAPPAPKPLSQISFFDAFSDMVRDSTAVYRCYHNPRITLRYDHEENELLEESSGEFRLCRLEISNLMHRTYHKIQSSPKLEVVSKGDRFDVLVDGVWVMLANHSCRPYLEEIIEVLRKELSG